MKRDVIIALDFGDAAEAMSFLDKFDEPMYVKVGMELFYSEGPDIIRAIKDRGHRIFLDLKLHDIPNTVERAMRVLSRLDIDMVNVHAAGTSRMMRAALRGLMREDGTRPLLIGVTQLTSTNQTQLTEEILIDDDMEDVIMKYAKNVRDSGLDGVVCSPLESAAVHAECGRDFLTVTPGIRFRESDIGDQSRITTPAEARRTGSDFIVVGRPVTRAEDPVAAYRRCKREFSGEEGERNDQNRH
ncbi:MAG: orotidine-5'-phosphate decarboxylase [Anaerovoracaceae bacterium]